MDFGTLLSNFAATAGNVYGQLNQPKNATAATATPTVTVSSTPAWQKYLPIGLVALGVVVVVLLFKRK